MIRKIISAEELEAKDKRNKKIIVIILGIIMLLSSLSYAFLSFENDDGGSSVVDKIDYNGLQLSKTNYGTWTFSISGYNFETRYNPEETLNISTILTKNIQSYSNQPLYFGVDSLEGIETAGNSEIVQNLGSFLLKYQTSCLTANCTEDAPIKNCSANNVIIFEKADKTSITENEKCIHIKYASGEAVRAADAFIFRVLGIR